MTPKQVKKYFKTSYNFRKITGMSDNTMHNWLKAGYVPFVAQKKIELITESVLIAEWDCQELKGWKPKD